VTPSVAAPADTPTQWRQWHCTLN